ncbi:MAG: PQQ-binding-like beta-propeller repeat protein [Phycisphaerales bacterium]|nr:PQQ-binding-like beta-propeller repeat protein [Phycisphaerales bacterium]
MPRRPGSLSFSFARAAALCALVGMGSVTIAGCGSGQRGSQSGGGTGGGAEAREPYSIIGYRPVWKTVAQVANRHELAHLDVTGDEVLAMDSSNILTYINARTGQVGWATDLGDSLARFYGSGMWRGNVWSVADTVMYFLDPRTGEVVDRQRLAALARTRPAIVGDMAVFGTSRGEVLGHNMRAGFKGWGFGYNRASTVEVPPVAVGAAVAVVTNRGELFVLDGLSGRLVGSNTLYDAMSGGPVADEDTVYCASLDQSIWAFGAYGGEQRWRVRTAEPIRGQAELLGDRLFVEIPSEGFACLRTSDGSRVWTAEGVRGNALGVRAGRLLVWDGRTMTVLDMTRGDVVDTVEIPGVSKLVVDNFVDGNLYAATKNGSIARYEPSR